MKAILPGIARHAVASRACTMGLVSRSVLGTRVDATSYEDASERVVRWAARDGPLMFALRPLT